MNCRRARQQLSRFVDGLLADREAQALTTHLADCPACRRLRDNLMAMGSGLRDLDDPPPPADIERRVAERWLAERRVAEPAPAVRRCAWRSRSPRTVAVGLALCFLTALGLSALHWERRGMMDAGSRRVSRPDSAGRARYGAVTTRWQGPRPRPVSVASRTAEARSPQSSGSLRDWLSTVSDPPTLPPVRPVTPAGDLNYLNGDPVAEGSRRWVRLPRQAWAAIETRVRQNVRVRDDFVTIPFPRLAAASDRAVVAATEAYQREAAVVDARLAREVTASMKATALSDLCNRLRADSGIQLVAGNSVADEKVTVLCEKQPLRDVMRQLSRPFGYTWLRSGTPGEYRYELVQDLKSQLLEEELRNRDRNAALLALEKELDRYRPYLSLSPDEALAKSKTAPPAERKLLEQYASFGWGPVQMYFRLTSRQQAALRAGETLIFSDPPAPGEPPRPGYYAGSPLPAEVSRGILQSLRGIRLIKREDGSYMSAEEENDPKALPLTAVPEAHAMLHLSMSQSERGRFTLVGLPGAFIRPHGAQHYTWSLFPGIGPEASGTPPAVVQIDNRTANAKLARDPALRVRVTLRPEPSCNLLPAHEAATVAQDDTRPDPRVTSADVLEALHRATGIPIVADFYTRLYKPDAVTVRNVTLFEALNQAADAMRLRWNKDAAWLQFRSTSYYDDRLKEVPHRMLHRWAEARRQHGYLTLDELVEIAQLSDAQLDGDDMAQGAQECWGLNEWRLLHDGQHYNRVRFLAGFTPAQRQEAMSPAGLPFTKMPLAQQQKFIEHALEFADEPLQSLEEFQGALLRVDYTQPGWFQWKSSWEMDGSRWVVPLEPGPQGRRALLPPVRERTREAALQAARRIFPPVTDGMLQVARRQNPQITAEQMLPQESQIRPTELSLVLVYIPGVTKARPIRVMGPGGGNLGTGVE